MPRKKVLNRIELQIEGFPKDGGAVRLDTLYNFLAEFKRTLAAIEKEATESDQAFLSYKIVTLTYDSPLRCVLEPIIPERVDRNLGNIVTKRFERDIREIVSAVPSTLTRPSKTKPIDPSTLEQFEKLMNQRKQAQTISIGLENNIVPLTHEFDEKVRKLLGNIYRSHGSFRGRLEAVNIHSTPCLLYIYPLVGPIRVRCTYPKCRFPQIGEHLGRTVDVSGIVKFRADEPHPYEIEIESITALRDKQAEPIASSIIGIMPGLTDDLDIPSYLNELRHE